MRLNDIVGSVFGEALRKYVVGDVSRFNLSHKFSNDRLWAVVAEKLSGYFDHDFYIYVGDFPLGSSKFNIDDYIRSVKPVAEADNIIRMIDRYEGNESLIDYASRFVDGIKQEYLRQHWANESDGVSLLDLCKNALGITDDDISKSIVVFKTQENQREMSPWIMIHQIAEAIFFSAGKARSGAVSAAVRRYVSFIEDFAAEHNFDNSAEMCISLFKFGSARRRAKNPEAGLDVPQEIMVEYLWHGARLRYNVPDGFDPLVVREFIFGLQRELKELLDACVGNIFFL